MIKIEKPDAAIDPQELVDWAVFNQILAAHIQNGVARGLYPQSLAHILHDVIHQRNIDLGLIGKGAES